VMPVAALRPFSVSVISNSTSSPAALSRTVGGAESNGRRR
jgi:hypothetical protein